MTRRHRVAILSFAHYHANFWAEAFGESPSVDLAAIWDDDAARGTEAASRFATRFEPDLARAIADVEAVAITAENARHPELVARAAAAGKAILCEKPMAADLAGADLIVAAVRAAGVAYMQSFPKRLDPASHALRDIVNSGDLGRIHLVRVRHGHGYGLDPGFHQRWYVQPLLGGGGALLDEGIHGADLLGWLFGPPTSVVATLAHGTPGLAVEDGATALFAYADGMTAELTASFLFTAAHDSIEIYGTRGTALLAGVDLASRDITAAGHLRSYVEVGGERLWRVHDVTPRFKLGRYHHQNAIAFAACLATGAPPPASLAEGWAAQEMIERAYQSAREGRRVSFAPP
jgi:predicted dehydrogenase